jgi:hypothetical protein
VRLNSWRRSSHDRGVASILSLIPLALAIVGLIPVSGSTGDLRVAEGVWTDGVEQRQYRHRYSTEAPNGALSFWTRILGSEEALKTLRQQNRLPIYHLWYHREAGEIEAESEVPEQGPAFSWPLAVGTKSTIEPLAREIAHDGSFDWRTWSSRIHVSPGWWTVSVVDAQGNPLPCGRDDCEFRIQVR